MPPWRLIPELAAHITCSLIPQSIFKFSYFPFSKYRDDLILVFVDGSRSALPPINHGKCGCTALITSAEISLVAFGPSEGLYTGISLSQPSGSICSRYSFNCFARSGYALL